MSFDEFYRELQPSLTRYLFRQLGGDADAAEDIAQDAFIRLLERPDLEDRAARVWLFTVATNLVRDRARANKRQQKHSEAGRLETVKPIPAPDEVAERSERIEKIRAALDELPERDRRILLLREEGFQYAEIAKMVDVAPGSVGTLIARALKRFADVYEGTEHSR